MSTGLIIALILIAAVVVVAAALMMRRRGGHGGRDLKRRFGPEYDRVVARHDGDHKAAERELAQRVDRHADLRERPLEPAQRERFEARWTAAQERFVDAPQEAVAEADRLLGELAAHRGFPDGGRYEEQLDALSVHHGHHVHGYRRVHRIAHAPVNGAYDGRADGAGNGPVGTEEMREAVVEARALFDDLLRPTRDERHGRSEVARTENAGRTGRTGTPAHTGGGRGLHLPWARHAKGS
jgi:hypothetical protein